VIAAYLMTFVISLFVSFVPSAIANLIADDNDLVNGIASVVGGTVSQMIATPYLAAVITLVYFDQRVRKEGFDLQLLAEGLGRPRDPDAPIPAPFAGPHTPVPQGEWWRDPVPAAPGTYGSGFEVPSSAEGSPPGADAPAPSSGGSWAAPSPEAPPPGAPTGAPPPGAPAGAPPPGAPAGAPPPGAPAGAPPPGAPFPYPPPGPPSPPDAPDADAEPPKRDPKRADWLPPEAPRGPGGL